MMEYVWKGKIQSKKRFTVGYLDENAFDEYHSYIISGLFEAAKKYDLNVIRFGHFLANVTSKHNSESKVLLDHIRQYDLDGLIFLGWARAVTDENHEDFLKQFGSIPLVSMGAGYDNLPSVYYQGDRYLREMLLHLIQHHGYSNIAFISPFWWDNRRNVYIEVMKDHGIYNPALCIYENEIANLDVPLRGRKAVSILLDKRQIKPDAIVSLYNAETEGIILELQSRGYDVPSDIAVTSYEDGEIGKCSTPAMTTIYFPWRELGYTACETMATLLTQGKVPFTTVVPGKIIIRDSCGCIPGIVHQTSAGSVNTASLTPDRIPEPLWKEIKDRIAEELNCQHLDLDRFQASFLDDFKNQSARHFLKTLEIQLRNLTHPQISLIRNLIPVFRKELLPYLLGSSQTLVWGEDLFQQAQVMLLDRLAGIWAYEEVQSRGINAALQEISQILYSNLTLESILNALEENLPKIQIPSCYIFLFNRRDLREHLFDDCSLAFKYEGQVRKKLVKLESSPASEKLKEVLFPENHSYAMMGHLLHVMDEYIGFVIFEPGYTDERIYQALSIHISTSLSVAMLLEKLDQSFKKLVDQAHKKGMADIANGILHNVNNVLNSINTSTHLIKDLVKSSPIGDLIKANQLLEQNLDHLEEFLSKDPRGEKLMQFYLRLAEPFDDLYSQLLYNTHRLDDKISLVDDIITSQRNYTGVKSTLEELYVVSVVEDALKMNQSSLEKYNIQVRKEYSDISNVYVQRTKLLHVLINLIKNAKEAMAEVPEENRELLISIGQDVHGKFVRIKDTGVGIPPESLECIFAYGFTTKKGGHGFGLHSCANYMTEMGGKIWAESPGPGKGATFILQFK